MHVFPLFVVWFLWIKATKTLWISKIKVICDTCMFIFCYSAGAGPRDAAQPGSGEHGAEAFRGIWEDGVSAAAAVFPPGHVRKPAAALLQTRGTETTRNKTSALLRSALSAWKRHVNLFQLNWKSETCNNHLVIGQHVVFTHCLWEELCLKLIWKANIWQK